MRKIGVPELGVYTGTVADRNRRVLRICPTLEQGE